MNRGKARDKSFWSIAALLVILYALIPVVWIISLSLKKSGDLTDGNFLPGLPVSRTMVRFRSEEARRRMNSR